MTSPDFGDGKTTARESFLREILYQSECKANIYQYRKADEIPNIEMSLKTR
jgi:hypothetical protein